MNFKHLILALILANSIDFSKAQCNDQLLTIASEKLKGYNYVKDYKIKMKKGKKDNPPFQKTTMILNSGCRYKIFTLNAKEYDGKLIADIFSVDGAVASTYSNDSKKHYEAVEFNCKKTGVYYLTLYFEGAEEGCGICILSIESDELKYK